MASTSETGHNKNVANFEDLISFCQGYGVTYNPSKNSLKIPQLTTLHTAAKNAIISVDSTSIAFNNATNARIIAFDGFHKFATRVLNALEATSATKEIIKDAVTINRKIQGTRAEKLKVVFGGKEANKVVDPNDPPVVIPEPKQISVSQQSYDSLIEHFSKMITLLTTEPSYTPNETDLKIVALTAKLTAFKTANTNVINAYTTVSNSRISRDKTLYDVVNGLCTVAKEVKAYVKSVFGATSPEYKEISGIAFKVIKK